ncbi:MAG: hypothetical protein A3B25_02005 [Candidatus Ryanbacteria bacterium RIFCSPLOWO2_01_FULL_48_26]|uniref:Uncharacterized protein n=1 Tax=Candidatus Ryanbacteria bacterium RIFCSPLOWO2_01_FULL_48_26 TaxID=1802126 RepID=A0A1G2GT06_9BACT|nr:MAG: hypothetical protein A3B25_02005 [Candidatus Ryanbacteria bacterium RIFCSPLOWO2_01_FULL_48_26]
MKTKKSFAIVAALGTLAILSLNALHVSAWNVTIDTNLTVNPKVISFETVFPEEVLFQPLNINLSQSFINSAFLDDVEYRITQKPKPRIDSHVESAYCALRPTDYTRCYPSLCPYLSKEPDNAPANDTGVPAFHNPNASSSIAYGRLAKSDHDTEDKWTIDLHVPCFRGECAQDNVVPAAYELDPSLEGKKFGCDLVVEVLSISYKTRLTVIKHVINNHVGTKHAGDFKMIVTGTNVQPTSTFPGSETGTTVTLSAGSYSVDEAPMHGYAKTLSSGCSGTIANGETKTCTITNEYIKAPPKCILTISKSVSATTTTPGATLWYTLAFKNTGTGNCTGGGVKIQDTVDPLLTFVSATSSANVIPGYSGTPLYTHSTRTLTWNANVLTPGQTGSATWKATVKAPSCGPFDIPNTARISSAEYNNFGTWVNSNTVHTTGTGSCNPTLIVIKHVKNDDGGVKHAGSFKMIVTGTNVQPTSTFPGSETGTTVTLNAGSYSVDEAPMHGYTKTLSSGCSGTIANGETKTCTITNDDIVTAQGCSPGYWKGHQHLDSWVGYAPVAQFSSVFENAFPGKTLLQVLNLEGGGLNALGRQAVAALLNSKNSSVHFAFTTSQVISMFNSVFPGSHSAYETLKNTLEKENSKRYCPLN